MTADRGVRASARYRWKRRGYLWRAFRSRRQLTAPSVVPRPVAGQILAFSTVRNESLRLPFFLDHYRRLGVDRFHMVDNGSTDGTVDLLRAQPDVTLWQTGASYRGSRFGVDWMNWLLRRHGAGHWCLSVDADELLVYDGCDRHGLRELTALLGRQRRAGFGALMVELYPKGSLGSQQVRPGQDPTDVLGWFDGDGYRSTRQRGLQNLWVQGGPRDRVFFPDRPQRAPTLNKLPLVRWRRGYAYVTSTHSMLPRRLNHLYDGPEGQGPAGALLHTKFLPDAPERAAQDKHRGEHFFDPAQFDGYYDGVMGGPDLWCSASRRYDGPRDLIAAGLMPALGWT